MVDAQIEGGSIFEEDEVTQGADAVVAVDAVDIPVLVFPVGCPVEHPLYRTASARTVDTAQAERDRRYWAAQHEAFTFEEAFPALAFGFGRRFLVHPLAASLGVNSSAGDENEAVEASLRGEGREQVERAIDVDISIYLFRGAGGRGGVDNDVEFRGQGGGRQRRGEVGPNRVYVGREGGRVTSEAKDGVTLGGEERAEGGSDVSAPGDQDAHVESLHVYPLFASGRSSDPSVYANIKYRPQRSSSAKPLVKPRSGECRTIVPSALTDI